MFKLLAIPVLLTTLWAPDISLGYVLVATDTPNNMMIISLNKKLQVIPTGGYGNNSYSHKNETRHKGEGQNRVIKIEEGKYVFVANKASNDVSLFNIQEETITLEDKFSSYGRSPTTLGYKKESDGSYVLYVLNSSSHTVATFSFKEGKISYIEGSLRKLRHEDFKKQGVFNSAWEQEDLKDSFSQTIMEKIGFPPQEVIVRGTKIFALVQHIEEGKSAFAQCDLDMASSCAVTTIPGSFAYGLTIAP